MMVLITGASGGLGRAMAVECAERGYSLFLTDLHESELAQIREGIRRRYDVEVFTRVCNLTDESQVTALFAYADQQGLRFDMLLNIAGIDFEGGFMDRDCQKTIGIVRLNIEATMRVTHEALARRADSFYLVFVSSLASLYPIPLKATYAASKRFLLDFSLALGQELRGKNVHVLSLCPGGLATTEDAMNGIAAQGFWGNATTNRLEVVAHRTVSRVLAGRKMYIPGLVNRTFSMLGGIVPRTLIARLLYNRWLSAQEKWLRIGQNG